MNPYFSAMTRWQKLSPRQLATMALLGTLVGVGSLVLAWFARQGSLHQIFQRLNYWQTHPPMWAVAPMMVGQYLLFWTVLLLLGVWGVMAVSPRPRAWSRTVVVGILAVLTGRYLLWRSRSTLNFSTLLNGGFSLGLFGLELLLLSGSVIQLVLLLRERDRRSQANRLEMDVLSGAFRPHVDILIPTYNEPDLVLRRTIIGCQALDYEAKTIYVLDDTRRPEIERLTVELGCEYRTRPDNRHAKAGNLNHAIAQIQREERRRDGARSDGGARDGGNSDLIVVFDADFVPTQNFLTRTVGFFQDPQVALVQTPQTFYNADPIARNLGLEHILTPEEEVFYRQIQPMRDAAGGVICSGTSFVMRRCALDSVGGFFTDSLSEDFFTGIRLAAQGYRLVYLNEKLSAGLAAESIADQAFQRIRWAQGTLQAFFVSANPLTIPGLRPLQRLAYLEGLLHWFGSVAQVGFLIMPLAYSLLGVIPVRASSADVLYFFLPYYLVNLSVFSWFNHRSRSALLSGVYSLVLCFPLAWAVIQTLLNPFGKGFKVTPKGIARDRFRFNWQLALPLMILFGVNAWSCWSNLGINLLSGIWQPEMPPAMVEQMRGFDLGVVWSLYNLISLGIALLVLIDAPNASLYPWFDLRRTVQISLGDQTFWGYTTALSEVGAEVLLTQSSFPNPPGDGIPVALEILEDGLVLSGRASYTRDGQAAEEGCRLNIMFEAVSLAQHKQLVQLLFCRPGQWKSRCAPSELRSLFLLLKILLKPRVIFDRETNPRLVNLTRE